MILPIQYNTMFYLACITQRPLKMLSFSLTQTMPRGEFSRWRLGNSLIVVQMAGRTRHIPGAVMMGKSYKASNNIIKHIYNEKKYFSKKMKAEIFLVKITFSVLSAFRKKFVLYIIFYINIYHILNCND